MQNTTRNAEELPSISISRHDSKSIHVLQRPGTNQNPKSFREIADSISKTLTNEFNSKKTDDLFFAENELRNINRKNEKKTLNKLKIWEKPSTANTEKDINIRKKIMELKKTCRESSGFNITALKGLKYLNRANVKSIVETSKIIHDKNSQKNNIPAKQESIFNFVTDNREISMKNFLLGLLRDERGMINTKENLVAKAIKDSEIRLDKDTKNFLEFIEHEKKIQKQNEIVLVKAFDANRELAAKKKKSNLENKQICDEIDRTIKGILSLKSYAGFVHIVLGDMNIKFTFDRSILDNRNTETFEVQIKDKDLEKTMDSLLNEFKEIDLDRNNPILPLLSDHSTMTLKFQEFEENILKLMENKQTIEKEYEKIKADNEAELKKLRDTEALMNLEFEKLKHAKEKDGKIIKELKKNHSELGTNSEVCKMIHGIYTACMMGEEPDLQTMKKIKSRKETELISEIMENLRKIEFEVIDYIEQLEEVAKTDEAKFKSIINVRKEDNKKKKQQAQKIKGEGEANMKKEKAEERMHRVVIKGRRVMERKLVGKGSRRKIVDDYLNKGNDDFNMLYYDNNDNDI